jgi:hypothetical protein
VRPTVLELIHVRLPPPQSASPDRPYDAYSDVHTTYYSQGVLLMSDSRNEVFM